MIAVPDRMHLQLLEWVLPEHRLSLEPIDADLHYLYLHMVQIQVQQHDVCHHQDLKDEGDHPHQVHVRQVDQVLLHLQMYQVHMAMQVLLWVSTSHLHIQLHRRQQMYAAEHHQGMLLHLLYA
jgi:hypothetical protein